MVYTEVDKERRHTRGNKRRVVKKMAGAVGHTAVGQRQTQEPDVKELVAGVDQSPGRSPLFP